MSRGQPDALLGRIRTGSLAPERALTRLARTPCTRQANWASQSVIKGQQWRRDREQLEELVDDQPVRFKTVVTKTDETETYLFLRAEAAG